MGTTQLAQTVRALSFETWCANHEDSHGARWCRELYPWPVFAAGDYSDAAVGSEQRIGPHELTVLEKRPGKVEGRTEFRVKLVTTGTTQGVVWRNGRWDDDFVLVAANAGQFITLFTKREDPAKNALVDFMAGRFRRLEANRCLPWSALLFRTLVAELAAAQGPWERHIAFDAALEPARIGYRPHPQYKPDRNRSGVQPSSRRAPHDWTPDEAASRVDELKGQGHGPQRHEGQVDGAQHDARVLRGTDPATGSPEVHLSGRKAGQAKKPPDSSSSFRSNEAYAQAEAKARESAEFVEKAKAGADEIKVKDLSLRDALGNDYLRHVEGRTTIGAAPGATRATDFNGGTVTAIYRRNASGGYDLVTMYPGGR